MPVPVAPTKRLPRVTRTKLQARKFIIVMTSHVDPSKCKTNSLLDIDRYIYCYYRLIHFLYFKYSSERLLYLAHKMVSVNG